MSIKTGFWFEKHVHVFIVRVIPCSNSSELLTKHSQFQCDLYLSVVPNSAQFSLQVRVHTCVLYVIHVTVVYTSVCYRLLLKQIQLYIHNICKCTCTCSLVGRYLGHLVSCEGTLIS